MELKDTAELMTSANYKDRFKAEVWQIRQRLMSLERIILDYHLGKLDFTLTCPINLLELQQRTMQDYLAVLEARAAIESVEL